MNAKSLQSCPTLCEPMNCSPPGSSVCGDSPGKNTGVGYHVLLQGIFLTQGSNLHLLCLLNWQASSLPLVPPAASLVTQTVKSQCLSLNPMSATFIFGTVSQVLHHSIPQFLIIVSVQLNLVIIMSYNKPQTHQFKTKSIYSFFTYIEAGGRYSPSTPTQDRYSKTKIAGQWRKEPGPCPD